MKNYFIYQNGFNSLVFSEEQDSKIYGYSDEREARSLKELIGGLILDGYPYDQLIIKMKKCRNCGGYDENTTCEGHVKTCSNCDSNQKQQHVDFDDLVSYMKILSEHMSDSESMDNLTLFLKLIAKSSSFAHLAHKELKKRMK